MAYRTKSKKSSNRGGKRSSSSKRSGGGRGYSQQRSGNRSGRSSSSTIKLVIEQVAASPATPFANGPLQTTTQGRKAQF